MRSDAAAIASAIFGAGLFCASAAAAAGPEYAYPAACTQCHGQIAANYARTGMGRSFRSVTRAGPGLAEFDGARVDHEPSREHFTAFRRDGTYYVRRDQTGIGGKPVNLREEPVDYVIGSGNHAFSYLRRKRDNTLVEFPVSWYAENGGHWGMSPAFDRPDHAGFSRTISYRCMFCHNGYPKLPVGADVWDGGTVYPRQLPEGIDCQRCHGPGSIHIEAARQRKALSEIRAAIVNPARLSPERRLEVCMQCHLETTSMQLPGAMMRPGRSVFSYRPGEPLADYMLYFDHAQGTGHDDKFELVSSAYRLRQSACFRANPERLTCTTCHDPHRAASREESVTASIEKTVRVCRNCHASLTASHPATPDCVSCHMPRRQAEDAIHITITDHLIQRPVPIQSPLSEAHDGNTLPYAGEVRLYYPKETDALSLAIAQVRQLANLPDGLNVLEKLLRERRPSDGEGWFDMAEALFGTAQAGKSIPFYQQALNRDRGNWRYLYGLGTAWSLTGQPGLAADAMARAAALAPQETSPLHGLAAAETARNRVVQSVSALRQILLIDPDSAPALNNLGNALVRTGDKRGAEDALRQAVRLQPELASLHVALADLLAQNGNPGAARFEFEEAIRIGPSTEIAQSAWFVALAKTGDPKAALAAYERAMRTQMLGAHNNLGNLLLTLGNPESAIREFRKATEADPASAAALINLGLTLAGHGDAAEAKARLREAMRVEPDSAAPLRQAAESTDPTVRAVALEVLRRPIE